MTDHPTERADLAWGMFVMATDRMEDPARSALRKVMRAYGDARFEQGRARESEIAAQRELEAQQDELTRRLRERGVLA